METAYLEMMIGSTTTKKPGVETGVLAKLGAIMERPVEITFQYEF